MLVRANRRAGLMGILALDVSILTLQAVTNPNSEQARTAAARKGGSCVRLWYKSNARFPIGIQNHIQTQAMHTTSHLDKGELDEAPAQAQKRGTNMIFRIEQLLPGSTTTTLTHTATITSPSPTKVSQSNFRPGVYTAQFTPKDTCSSGVPTSALLSCMTTLTTNGSHLHCLLKNGVLAMSASLLWQIKLSEDVYSFNALFELHAGQVRIRLVRDIAHEDEIVAWFCEELVLLMGIPFLTPLNIQGNSQYTCHLCQLSFETPHPLKIHLALGCGRSSMNLLWMRLHYALKSTEHTTPTTLMLSPPLGNSSISSTSPNTSPPRQTTRLSAFRPLSVMQSLTIPDVSSQSSETTLSYRQAISMSTPLSTHSMNAAAQIEAIVSNMGASKQGHLCIYCGKVYSRKYGLKIHIRTHTGFKPLKCKFCLRPFGDPSNLNKHVRLHLQTQSTGNSCGLNIDVDPEASFQCQLCSKVLARQRDLQKHMESRHSGTLLNPTSTATTTTTTATVTVATMAQQ